MERSSGVPMNCTQASDLLPWLMNGTLGSEERNTVISHLQGCAACRRELDETRDSARMASLHPEPEALTAYIGGMLSTADTSTLELHLTRCLACAEDVRMAREGLARIATADRRTETFRWWPAAAGVAAGVAAGWLLAALWLDAGGMRSRLRSAELRIQALQSDQAILQREREAARGPRLNLVTVDLFPSSLSRRSGETAANRVQLPAAPDAIALVLNSQIAPRQGVFGARLLDGQGRLIWQASGLIRQQQGEFTIQFPRGFLPAGDYELRLVSGASEEALEVYRFRNRP